MNNIYSLFYLTSLPILDSLLFPSSKLPVIYLFPLKPRKLYSWKIIVTIDGEIFQNIRWQEPVQFSLLHLPDKMEITLEDHEGKRIGSSDIQPTDIEMKVLRIPLITSNKNDHYVLELSLHVEVCSIVVNPPLIIRRTFC